MKRFIYTTFLFGSMFFIFDKLFYFVIAYSPDTEVDKRLELLLKGKINKDIVVFGSSRGARDIIASQLEVETGLSAYNLSYMASDIEFHEFLLRALVKFDNPPKTALLVVDDPAELIPDSSISFRLERLYPLVKYKFVNQEMIARGEKSQLSWALLIHRLTKKNFDFRKKHFTQLDTIMNCGSMPIPFQKPGVKLSYRRTVDMYTIEDEVKSKVKAFIHFQDICRSNNIHLILCFVPNFRSPNQYFEKRLNEISFSETEFFIYDTTNYVYQNKDFFYDGSHLMKNGAEIYTHELSTFLNEKMNIKDHETP